jgi:hypothetical protein
MKSKKSLVFSALLLIVVIIIAFFLFVLDGDEDGGGDNSPKIALANGDVAILVIDVFDTRKADEITANIAEQNCLVTPEGQGHVAIQGAGNVAIQGAGNVAIQGAGNANQETHGEIVYSEIRDLLRDERGGSQTVVTTGAAQFPNASADLQQAIRDLEQWQLDNGNVLLVALDTEGYTTSVIAQRIPATIDLLEQEFGISRFVVNMSFAVIPCDLLIDDVRPNDEELLQQYLDALAGEEFDELRATFEALLEENDGNVSVTINQPEFATVRGALLAQELNRTTTIYQVQNPEELVTQLAGCYDLYGGSDLIEQPTEQPTEIGEQAGQLQEGTCADPIFPADPMFAWAIQAQTEAVVANRGPRIINIASAGNFGSGFAFAPGYYPTVVSVSADYSNSGNTTVDALVANGTIVSNDGEVQFNGLYERSGFVYPGTSYAAPRLSIEAAIYLLGNGAITCTGSTDSSTPPLAYPFFQNLPRTDAASQYCEEFNRLVP